MRVRGQRSDRSSISIQKRLRRSEFWALELKMGGGGAFNHTKVHLFWTRENCLFRLNSGGAVLFLVGETLSPQLRPPSLHMPTGQIIS